MKQEHETITTRSKAANPLLRGIAIFFVLVLHTLASLRPETYLSPERQIFAIPLDQLGRFCVPMFVMLSGYAFWAKFIQTKWSWGKYANNFLFRQAQKLLPLYVVASVIFMIFFRVVQQWSLSASPAPIWHQFLFGEADYHLYFVPMIFQLYLCFPIFYWLMKKAPWITAGAIFAFQCFLYFHFSSLTPHWIVTTFFLTDQTQYLWFFSWVWYSVLGMLLARFSLKTLTLPLFILLFFVLSLGSWIWASWESLYLIRHGVDAIIALRGTRISVLFYATSICIFLFCLAVSLPGKMSKKVLPVAVLGNWSYFIYLFHTIVLRIIFYL